MQNAGVHFVYMDIDDKIMEELQSINQPLGVLSTVSEGCKSQSAAMYYVYDNAFNLYFISRKGSRKCKNIEKNPHVSFVIATENPPRTIQIEGRASHVTDPKEEADHFTRLVKMASEHIAIPPVSQMDGSEMVFMKVTTDWIRFGTFECMREEGQDKFMETNLL